MTKPEAETIEVVLGIDKRGFLSSVDWEKESELDKEETVTRFTNHRR